MSIQEIAESDVGGEIAHLPFSTSFGLYDLRAFQGSSGTLHLAFVLGKPWESESPLVRVHSECITGEVFGSRRCDCGLQLRYAFRRIWADGAGVLVYVVGHEGRGIGLAEKLRAYALQDSGLDTIDANRELGHPVDQRDFSEAAEVLKAVGLSSLRLLTNNPVKQATLEAAGLGVRGVIPLPISAHTRNRGYVDAKQRRLSHRSPARFLGELPAQELFDTGPLIGELRNRADRPHIVVKFAQTLDGRIATASGDSKWISSENERRIAHALRASCDAIVVGAETVVKDDPQLNVRLVEGPSPVRVVLDSTLRTPLMAQVLDRSAPTLVVTTENAPRRTVDALKALGVAVEMVSRDPSGVDLHEAMGVLRARGIESVLVEGGGRTITSFLRSRLCDRLVASISPSIIGAGTSAIGELGIGRIADRIELCNRKLVRIGDEMLVAGDPVYEPLGDVPPPGDAPVVRAIP